MAVIIFFSPVQNKFGLIGNPDNVVLHGMGEKPALKMYFSAKLTFVKTELLKLLQSKRCFMANGQWP